MLNSKFGITVHRDAMEVCRMVERIDGRFGIVPVSIFPTFEKVLPEKRMKGLEASIGRWQLNCLWRVPSGMKDEDFKKEFGGEVG